MRINKFSATGIIASLSFAMVCLTGCLFDEQHPGTYYTFTGHTIASELESRPEDFSEFIKVLKLAHDDARRGGASLWTELSTYGEHTVFAPYNACIEEFLKERSQLAGRTYNSIEDLYQWEPTVIDTLAKTHMVDITCYVGEMKAGSFPKTNMNDKYLTLSFDSVLNTTNGTDSTYRLRRCVNKFSHIVERDDSCTNGVIHTIDKCINFKGSYVYDLIEENPQTSLFAEALKVTGLSGPNNLLNKYKDEEYKIGDDSTGSTSKVTLVSANKTYRVSYWEERKDCFTVFTVTNKIFHDKYGVDDLDGLIALAKSIYDPTYPEDANITDLKDRKNSLNRFISYHILPFGCSPSNFNTNLEMITTYNAGVTDPEDFFETVSPHTLMRISTAKSASGFYDKVYINRMGKEGNGTRDYEGPYYDGVRILGFDESGDAQQIADNGYVLFVEDILKYDNETRLKILNRRLRIDCATLSPDFITSGARQYYYGEHKSGSDRPGFGFRDPLNFSSIYGDYVLSVRPVNKSDSYAYEGDGVDIMGNFDICIKLPPIPYDGTWELRLSTRCNSACGIVQHFIGTSQTGVPESWTPLGIPTDLRASDLKGNPTIGWYEDSSLDDDPEAIDAADKAMHNRGWMKGPDSQKTSTGYNHRDVSTMARRILMTEYMRANNDYYLRIKQVLQDDESAQFLFDYLELVPKVVYDNTEDKL